MSVTVTIEADDVSADEWPEESPKTIDTENAIANLKRAKIAELAACEYLDGVRNPETETDGDDGGYDVRLPDGSTVDVKSTKYKTGNLLVPNYVCGRLRADYYLLAIVPKDDPTTVRFEGYATPDEILARPTLTDFKNPCKKIEPCDLHATDDLLTDGDKTDAFEHEADARF